MILAYMAPQAGPLKKDRKIPVSPTQHFSQTALLQECDDGEAVKKALLQLGLPGLHRSIVGGASFTHGRWDRNFLQLLKGLWHTECEYSAVTLAWAGNDLTSQWTNGETLTDAIEHLKAFGEYVWHSHSPHRCGR